MEQLLKEEKELVRSISRKGVTSMMIFVIYKIAAFMVLVYMNEIQWWTILIYLTDIFGVFLIPLFSVQKPEMTKLLMTIRQSLSDGKISPDEGMAIIRQAWFVILGFWADYSQTESSPKITGKVDPIP